MKKILLAGTALVAFAAPAKAELKLDLGGYYYGYVGYVNQDNDNNQRNFDWRRDTEVHFKGETTLDNGLTVGTKIELEGEQEEAASSNRIDENNLYFSGNWGKVILGSEDNAAYLLQVVAPAADEFVDGYDPKFRFVNAPATNGADNNYAQGNADLINGDADKVTYITPKFNGFQAGVSYTNDVQAAELVTSNGLDPMTADNDNEIEEAYDAGFRYDGEFNGVGIAAGAGYTLGTLGVETAGDEDYKEWNVGLSASFDAFTLGVAYNTDNGAADDADTDNWVIGASYEFGPYTFGASYFTSEAEEAGSEDELDRYSIGGNYAFGPGMTFRGSVNMYDYEGNTPAENHDAVSVLIGTAVNF